MRSHTRMMQINPPEDWLKTGWTQDSQVRTRLVDSLFCIMCSSKTMHSLFFGSFFFVTLPYFMLHRYGDFFGRPYNMEWWNDEMTEWRNIAPNTKRRNIKKCKKSVKNKWLCNRFNCEPTSQRWMRRCMHRRASSRCQGRGQPLWFPEGKCHRGNGPLPVVRSKEYPRRFDQWWWALRYVFS